MKNLYIKDIRQRIGLEENDSSRDKHISTLEPFERVQLISGWHLGSDYWANTFKTWCESQGVYLTTNKNDSNRL